MNEDIEALKRKEKDLLRRMTQVVTELEAAEHEVSRLETAMKRTQNRLAFLRSRSIPSLKAELRELNAALDPIQDALDVQYGVPERFPWWKPRTGSAVGSVPVPAELVMNA